MDIGETIAQCAEREVKEETGLAVTAYHLVGVYSDPDHVFAYSDGEVRQEFSVCFACRILGGDIAKSDESLEVQFWAVQVAFCETATIIPAGIVTESAASDRTRASSACPSRPAAHPGRRFPFPPAWRRHPESRRPV
jgi:ADP-ribose pyrophosphatase YjhB (NUDIX family)